MGRIINRRTYLVEKGIVEEPFGKVNVEIDNERELTLLEAVCQIIEVVSDSNYDPSIYDQAARPIEYIRDVLGLTAKQAIVYAIAMDSYYDDMLSVRDIARYLSISPLKGMTFGEDLEELCKRKFLIENFKENMTDRTYKVTAEAIVSLQHNCAICVQKTSVNSSEDWFNTLNQYIVDRTFNNMDYDSFCRHVESHIEQNKTLPMIKKYLAKEKFLQREEKMLFWWICNMVVFDGVETIIPENFRRLYANISTYRAQRKSLAMGVNGLIEHGLVRRAESNECNIKDCYELTPWVNKEVLEEFDLAVETQSSSNIIEFTSITPKQLYYNEKELKAIDELTSLLEPTRFSEVCGELQKQGFRKGFACLFHGSPGTGKTETVLQLARITGRNVIKVDVSDIKSKWVGESEKNIKAIFSQYHKLVKESEVAPILLFNEADAIIGKRFENVTRSVDKMENSMQNIILEELENLEGILIATTNLTSNLDSAFERRFIYKLEFEKPSVKVKSLIWQSMISELSTEEARKLAYKYDFSGGQIENVARKSIVSKILSGKEISLNTLISHCDSELIDKQVSRRVGF